MSDEEKKTTEDPLLDHEYDGIQEYDNNLPRWWVWLFVITSVFGVGYFAYFHMLGTGEVIDARYEKERAAFMLEEIQRASETQPVTDEELVAMVNDEFLSVGQDIYRVNCANCHANDGGGLVGPNLVDDYWIHGNAPTDIVHIVRVGVPAKGMIPWDGMLSDEEIFAVSMYVKSLHGQEVASAKAPEGELIPE